MAPHRLRKGSRRCTHALDDPPSCYALRRARDGTHGWPRDLPTRTFRRADAIPAKLHDGSIAYFRGSRLVIYGPPMIYPWPQVPSAVGSPGCLGLSPGSLRLLPYLPCGPRRHLVDEIVYKRHEPAVRLGRTFVGRSLVAGYVPLVQLRVLPVLEVVERASALRPGQHAKAAPGHPLGRFHGPQPEITNEKLSQ